MNLSNADLMGRINAAIKGVIEPSTLGLAVLQPQKAARFVRAMEAKTTVLPMARFISMDAPQVDIDRISFPNRLLTSGHDTANAHRDLVVPTDFVEPTIGTSSLIAKELQAIASIRDKTLRRSIERGNLENTIIDLLGEAAGTDLEEYAFFADTSIPYATDAFLHQSNGWLREAASILYGADVAGQIGKDFDPASALWPENLFQAIVDTIPKKFLGGVSEWHFFVTWSMFDAYLNKLRARGTALGDQVQTNGMGQTVKWKGFNVTWVPLLERFPILPDSTDAVVKRDRIEGEAVLFTHPDNMAWGVLEAIQIEPEREAKARRTDFVLSFEGDAGFEDPNAAVTALIDKANPTAV